ncbi:MAG: relaxase/mobilization nuclease domain-containing protein [Oscillospiraceae bacterium]|nr:relaxase/mobilization nuclease domain-containing protein [Oscillospiraceae bacterium]
MVRVKVKRNTSGGIDYLEKACNYVKNDEKLIYIYGHGVDPYHTGYAYEQMLAVRRYYGKISGNPLIHFIISFEGDVEDKLTAWNHGHRIASYFDGTYQTIWCIHQKKRGFSRFHMHIIVNSVSYTTGKMFVSGVEEMKRFQEHIERVTMMSSWFYFADADTSDDA